MRRSQYAVAALISLFLAVALILPGLFGTFSAPPRQPSEGTALAKDLVATFSIVAYDPETGDLGVAVQSKFFGVGAVVPFAAAGVGAIATQSLANTTYGPRGLELLAGGMSPRDVIDRLVADDPQRAMRQVGVIDASGNAANFTGDGCLVWAGARLGTNFSAQGNILAGPEVVDAMGDAFVTSDGDLATRLIAALAAGQQAGGDVRGRQSAALLVVREGAGYGGFDDHYIDLRVDDHETPIVELKRLLDIRHAQVRAQDGEQMLAQGTLDLDEWISELSTSRLNDRHLVGLERQQAERQVRQAAADERAALVREAIAAFSDATRLDPDNGWYWLALAAAHLTAGEREAAAAAGVRALEVDPWVKTGILRGFGSLEVAEELLEDEEFRRAWEAIQVAYRSP